MACSSEFQLTETKSSTSSTWSEVTDPLSLTDITMTSVSSASKTPALVSERSAVTCSSIRTTISEYPSVSGNKHTTDDIPEVVSRGGQCLDASNDYTRTQGAVTLTTTSQSGKELYNGKYLVPLKNTSNQQCCEQKQNEDDSTYTEIPGKRVAWPENGTELNSTGQNSTKCVMEYFPSWIRSSGDSPDLEHKPPDVLLRERRYAWQGDVPPSHPYPPTLCPKSSRVSDDLKIDDLVDEPVKSKGSDLKSVCGRKGHGLWTLSNCSLQSKLGSSSIFSDELSKSLLQKNCVALPPLGKGLKNLGDKGDLQIFSGYGTVPFTLDSSDSPSTLEPWPSKDTFGNRVGKQWRKWNEVPTVLPSVSTMVSKNRRTRLLHPAPKVDSKWIGENVANDTREVDNVKEHVQSNAMDKGNGSEKSRQTKINSLDLLRNGAKNKSTNCKKTIGDINLNGLERKDEIRNTTQLQKWENELNGEVNEKNISPREVNEKTEVPLVKVARRVGKENVLRKTESKESFNIGTKNSISTSITLNTASKTLYLNGDNESSQLSSMSNKCMIEEDNKCKTSTCRITTLKDEPSLKPQSSCADGDKQWPQEVQKSVKVIFDMNEKNFHPELLEDGERKEEEKFARSSDTWSVNGSSNNSMKDSLLESPSPSSTSTFSEKLAKDITPLPTLAMRKHPFTQKQVITDPHTEQKDSYSVRDNKCVSNLPNQSLKQKTGQSFCIRKRARNVKRDEKLQGENKISFEEVIPKKSLEDPQSGSKTKDVDSRCSDSGFTNDESKIDISESPVSSELIQEHNHVSCSVNNNSENSTLNINREKTFILDKLKFCKTLDENCPLPSVKYHKSDDVSLICHKKAIQTEASILSRKRTYSATLLYMKHHPPRKKQNRPLTCSADAQKRLLSLVKAPLEKSIHIIPSPIRELSAKTDLRSSGKNLSETINIGCSKEKPKNTIPNSSCEKESGDQTQIEELFFINNIKSMKNCRVAQMTKQNEKNENLCDTFSCCQVGAPIRETLEQSRHLLFVTDNTPETLATSPQTIPPRNKSYFPESSSSVNPRVDKECIGSPPTMSTTINTCEPRPTSPQTQSFGDRRLCFSQSNPPVKGADQEGDGSSSIKNTTSENDSHNEESTVHISSSSRNAETTDETSHKDLHRLLCAGILSKKDNCSQSLGSETRSEESRSLSSWLRKEDGNGRKRVRRHKRKMPLRDRSPRSRSRKALAASRNHPPRSPRRPPRRYATLRRPGAPGLSGAPFRKASPLSSSESTSPAQQRRAFDGSRKPTRSSSTKYQIRSDVLQKRNTPNSFERRPEKYKHTQESDFMFHELYGRLQRVSNISSKSGDSFDTGRTKRFSRRSSPIPCKHTSSIFSSDPLPSAIHRYPRPGVSKDLSVANEFKSRQPIRSAARKKTRTQNLSKSFSEFQNLKKAAKSRMFRTHMIPALPSACFVPVPIIQPRQAWLQRSKHATTHRSTPILSPISNAAKSEVPSGYSLLQGICAPANQPTMTQTLVPLDSCPMMPLAIGSVALPQLVVPVNWQHTVQPTTFARDPSNNTPRMKEWLEPGQVVPSTSPAVMHLVYLQPMTAKRSEK